MSHAPKKQKTDVLPKLPKISDALDGPVVQTLATVCAKLYDAALFAVYKPKDGAPVDQQLDQLYEMVTKSGAYKEGGVYSADDSSYTGGEGPLVSSYSIFNKNTAVEGKPGGSPSLAEYGTVIDGFTDFYGELQCVTPPFAALIVQPKDTKEVRALLPEAHSTPFLAPPTLPRLPTERECCPPSAGPYPHPRLARISHDTGLGQRFRGHSHSLYATAY